MAAISSSARAGRSRRRWRSASAATRARISIALHTEQDNTPDGGVPTIGVEGFYNPAFDTGRCERGRHPDARRPRQLLRPRQRLRRDQGHDVHGALRTRLQRERLDPQHLALWPPAAVLRAHRRERADRDRPESGQLDRGAHAPGEEPGKHAADEPDQLHRESRVRFPAATPHGRHRVHQRGAVQPHLCRARHADHARECLQPESQRRAAGLRAGAQRPLRPRRNADRRRVPVRHADVQRALGSDGGLPRRQLRDGFRQRGLLDSRKPPDAARGYAGSGASVGRRHVVLVQGRRGLQAGRERQHLSVACDFAAAARRREPDVLQQR